MANDIVTTTTKRKLRSFWDTKEGTTGMVIGTGILGAIGWGAYKIMPYIANLLENTVYALLFLAIAVGLIYVLVIDSTLRNRLWLMYQLLMRALTYSIIKYDPVGVLRETQKMARARIQRVSDGIDKVKGKLRILKDTRDGFISQQNTLREEVNWMQANGKSQLEINSHAAKIGRLDESITRLNGVYGQIKGVADKLDHARDTLVIMNQNIDFEIDLQEKEYFAANAAYEAWGALRSAFAGNTDMDEMRAMTLAYMADDYKEKMGLIDSFVSDSEKYISHADMQNDIYAEKGLRLIQKLNSQSLDLDVTPRLVAPAAAPATAPSGTGAVDYSRYKQ